MQRAEDGVNDEGRKIVRSFSMQRGLVAQVDAVAARIKRATGLQVDRSKIFSALCELLVDAQSHLATHAIVDSRTLREQIAKAIAESTRSGLRPRSRSSGTRRGAPPA